MADVECNDSPGYVLNMDGHEIQLISSSMPTFEVRPSRIGHYC